MITFGMPTLMETGSVEETVSLCGELGLSFLELNTNFPKYQPHLLDDKLLRQWGEKYGVSYSIHLNDDLAVAEFHPAIAQGYRTAVLDAIALAKKIGASKIVMHSHPGAKYTMPDRIVYFYEAYSREYLAQMKEFRELCRDAIGDTGMKICMENTKGYMDFQKEALDLLLESPAFGLTLDIGHNDCAGCVDEPWILERKDRLHHMHIHDVKNHRNDHLALGTGEMELAKYLSLADECACTAVLETKTVAGLKASVDWLKNAGYLG